MKTTAQTRIESLEARIAPAKLTGQVLAYTDFDGDHVTLTFSKGTLTPDIFDFDNLSGVDGTTTRLETLQTVDLTAVAGIDDANITMKVTRAGGGDGLANIRSIDASHHSLGAVSIKGDLGKINVGDNPSPTSVLGMKSLSVGSLGVYGSGPGGADLGFNVGSIKVAGDVTDTFIFAASSIGPVTIGGSLTRSLLSTGSLGAVKIGHDIIGGDSADGRITAISIASLSVGGSIFGGSSNLSGSVSASTSLGPTKITGDLVGGDGQGSGVLSAGGTSGVAISIASVTIGGSLIGGGGQISGAISSSAAVDPAKIGPVKIGRDMIGGGGFGSGSIGASTEVSAVTIGGSLIGADGESSGRISAGFFGKIGAIRIGHDVIGGSGNSSGRIVTSGMIAGVTVGGSMQGGHGNDSGNVVATGDVGPVKVGGNVAGGFGASSGQIFSGDVLKSVTIGGALIGSDGSFSGSITGGKNDMSTGDTFALGPVKIGGSVIGGKGSDSARIGTDGPLTSFTTGGSVIGNGPGSGQVISGGDMGAVKIGGDLRGASISGSETDVSFTGYIQGQRIASVRIGGSIVAGIDSSTGGALGLSASIRAVNDIGAIVVKGSILGNVTADGSSPVIISARGQEAVAPGATTDVAIKSLTVGGRVEHMNLLAGYSPALVPMNANAQVGAVKVGADWIASNLVAGVSNDAGTGSPTDDNLNFGNNHDAFIGGAVTSIAKIASISIKGFVIGSAANTDHFGFVAHTIGSFKLTGASLPVLTPSAVDLARFNGFDTTLHLI